MSIKGFIAGEPSSGSLNARLLILRILGHNFTFGEAYYHGKVPLRNRHGLSDPVFDGTVRHL
jgi:hypothetical protein